jgi:hypothetical protein
VHSLLRQGNNFFQANAPNLNPKILCGPMGTFKIFILEEVRSTCKIRIIKIELVPQLSVLIYLQLIKGNLWVDDGKFEYHVLAGQRTIHLGEGIKLGLDVHDVLGVEVHLEGLGAVSLVSDALADDLGGVDDVLQDGVLDGGEGACARANALLHSRTVDGLGLHGALGNDNDMLATMDGGRMEIGKSDRARRK